LWVTKILGLDGNIKQGLSEIQEVIKKDPVFDEEAQLIDFLIRSYVTGMTEADLNAMKTYIKARPDHQMFYLFGASILIKNNQSQEAWYFLQHQPKGSDYLPAPSFAYLKGEVMIQKGQYAEAIKFYEQYLKMYMGLNFIKDTHYKLYLCHWFLGDSSKNKILINNILTLGNDVTEQDKVALKFAKNLLTTPPLPQVLKSRRAFDGGYYAQALTELSGLDENTLQPKDLAEYNYRKGRIYQKIPDFQKSISFYSKAIALSKPARWSFGANACLQLGYIYLAQNQKDKAKIYFQEALNYPKHEYKNSVDNKAQAALNSL
jgi:tetratricopeptide (TPR) repeat protein